MDRVRITTQSAIEQHHHKALHAGHREEAYEEVWGYVLIPIYTFN